MKVLIIGYACVPNTGGEISNAWHWALHLSRFHEITVLACPGYNDPADTLPAKYPSSALKFHWLSLSRLRDPWDLRKSNLGLAIHYLQWLKLAYARAAELHEQVGFDLIHHVSFGTVGAPSPFWRLPVPFVWGPVGGAQRAPSAFRHYMPLSGPEILRHIQVNLLPFSPYFRKTAKSSAAILATNRETQALLTKAGNGNVRLFLDSGIPADFLLNSWFSKPKTTPFTLLWAGRMEPRKALPLALEALAETKNLDVKMLVAGDGTMRQPWESYAKDLDLGRKVEFLGQVSWNEMSRLYQSADTFLFTSLRDSFGTQVLEAMAHALPILTLNHQGVGTFVPNNAGIKVSVISPSQTVVDLANGIRWLASHPEERLKMGEAALAYARTQTWENRAERMSEIYEQVVARQSICAQSPLPP